MALWPSLWAAVQGRAVNKDEAMDRAGDADRNPGSFPGLRARSAQFPEDPASVAPGSGPSAQPGRSATDHRGCAGPGRPAGRPGSRGSAGGSRRAERANRPGLRLRRLGRGARAPGRRRALEGLVERSSADRRAYAGARSGRAGQGSSRAGQGASRADGFAAISPNDSPNVAGPAFADADAVSPNHPGVRFRWL